MSLTPSAEATASASSVQKLQRALHAKAKGSPQQRFHALYDKVYCKDILAHAYACCRANKGAAGVDGQSFADIETYGLERWLGELTHELRNKTYRPAAVRRVYIPKPDGKQRPLGIPTVKDRVVQTAAMLVLEPIFEADLQPEQYAYRPGRSALDAVVRVHGLLNMGHGQVVDADLSGYFDSIPHAELMKSVARRVVDGAMLHLIKMWLEAPVEETDERGGTHRTTRNKDEARGTPQGAPISPLLSNLYMRRFVLGWKQLGHERRLQARIVNYADDFVICCRGTADKAMEAMQEMMSRLKLTVNPAKTHICSMPQETFDFLGYTFGRCYSWKDARPYIGTKPSKKRVARIQLAISEMTSRGHVRMTPEEMVAQINRVLVGWANYFCRGPVSRAYQNVDRHTRHRLRQWLRAKHGEPRIDYKKYSDPFVDRTLGLIRLANRRHILPRANA
jgi:group II intron reverse transcriptase/maturase